MEAVTLGIHYPSEKKNKALIDCRQNGILVDRDRRIRLLRGLRPPMRHLFQSQGPNSRICRQVDLFIKQCGWYQKEHRELFRMGRAVRTMDSEPEGLVVG